MSSFVFPPPPPPPPKAAGPPSADYQNQGRGGRGRGAPRASFGARRSRGSSRGRAGYRNPNFESSHYQRAPFNHDVPSASPTGNEASRKRKLTAFQERPDIRPINRSRIEAAPPVPSFGFSLPVQGNVSVPATLTASSHDAKAKRNQKVNQLGLTPQADLREESEQEDIDEEAVFAAKGISANLRVEYKGRVYELGTPEGLRQWLEERRKNWPTKAKVDERNREALKQKQEALRRRLEEDQARKNAQKEHSANQIPSTPTKTDRKSRSSQDTKAALRRHLAKAEKLRAKLKLLENNPMQVDSEPLTVDQEAYTVTNTQDSEPTEQKEPEKLPIDSQLTVEADSINDKKPKSLPSSEESSTSDSDDSDSDSSSALSNDSEQSTDLPEEASSKIAVPQSAPSSTIMKATQVCRAFASTGRCKWGNRCHYKHEAKQRRDTHSAGDGQQARLPTRKGLYQRLVEEEQEAENRLALQAIKHLGQNGFFK